MPASVYPAPSIYLDRRSPGRTATFIIAASNASANSKAQADFVCSGINDQLLIQAVIDSIDPLVGGLIRLTEGRFHLGGSINIDRTLSFEGVGRSWPATANQTELYLDNGMNADGIIIDPAVDAEQISIRDIFINGNSAGQGAASHGISAFSTSATYRLFEFIRIKIVDTNGCGIRVVPTLATIGDCWWQDVVIEDCVEDAIFLDGTANAISLHQMRGLYIGTNLRGIRALGFISDIEVHGGIIINSERENIHLSGIDGNMGFYGTEIRAAGAEVIDTYRDVWMDLCHGVIFDGCRMYSPVSRALQAFYLRDCDSCIIKGNLIRNNRQGAILLESSTHCIISKNSLRDNCQAANNTHDEILLDDDGANFSTRNIVEGNIIREVIANKARYGIREDNVGDDYNILTGNQVDGAVTAGVLIQGVNSEIGHNIE